MFQIPIHMNFCTWCLWRRGNVLARGPGDKGSILPCEYFLKVILYFWYVTNSHFDMLQDIRGSVWSDVADRLCYFTVRHWFLGGAGSPIHRPVLGYLVIGDYLIWSPYNHFHKCLNKHLVFTWWEFLIYKIRFVTQIS